MWWHECHRLNSNTFQTLGRDALLNEVSIGGAGTLGCAVGAGGGALPQRGVQQAAQLTGGDILALLHAGLAGVLTHERLLSLCLPDHLLLHNA